MSVRNIATLSMIGLCGITMQSAIAQPTGQPKMITRQIKAGDDMFMLPELGAVIIQDSSGISVAAMPPDGHVPKGYESVDLKEQDRLIMLAGKKLLKVADLREFYEKAAIGDTLKLGVKRGEQMRLVSIVKADPANLPQRQIKMIKDGGEAEGGPDWTGAKTEQVVTAGDGTTIVPELGLVLKPSNNGLMVEATLGNVGNLYPGGGPEKGDFIRKLNDRPVRSAEDFEAQFAAIATGAPVRLEYERGGKPLVVALDRPAAPKVMIKKESSDK